MKRSDSSPASAACGSSREDVRQWMESVQNSAVEPSSSAQVQLCFSHGRGVLPSFLPLYRAGLLLSHNAVCVRDV